MTLTPLYYRLKRRPNGSYPLEEESLFLSFFFFAGDAEQTGEEQSEAEVYIRAVLLWEMMG